MVEQVYCVSRDEYDYEHDDMDCLFFISLEDAVKFIQLNRDFSHRPDISDGMINLHGIIEKAHEIHKHGDKSDELEFTERYMEQKIFYFIHTDKDEIEPRAGHITDINFTNGVDEHSFRYCIEVCNYSGTGGLMAFSIEESDNQKDFEYELAEMLFKINRHSRKRDKKKRTEDNNTKKTNTKSVPKGDKVYFIQENNSKAIKIGKAVDPNTRLKQLQTGHPYELKILKVISGGYKEEKKLHKLFEKYRLAGEWFEYNDELMGYIDDLKACEY